MAKTGTGYGTTKGQHSFAQVPHADIQRSTFDRSCGRKSTFNAGDLVPVFIDEALPGDTMSMHMTTFARISTLLFPIMDNIYLDVFFFSVPNRLVWDNWEKFNGAQDAPGDDTSFLIPTLTAAGAGFGEGSLSDHFAMPTLVAGLEVNSLFHRAYNLIFNEWFRDENLQDPSVVDKDDGPDTESDYANLLKRGKRHDYFTSCLPWPQKGDAVELPLGTSAPLTITADGTNPPTWENAGGDAGALQFASGTGVGANFELPGSPTTNVNLYWNEPNLSGIADLSSATASTINALRQAFQIQRLLERDARGGTRYTEILKAHFGVTSPDGRLQRPEYLGGGITPLLLTPVAATIQNANVDLGDLASYGIAAGSNVGFTKSFTEHCLIIGMVSARADLNYQQGLERMHSRQTRYDYYWPALSHIGEQAVLNKEIYADASATDELTFGYQERYAEYRYKPSTITGRLRSNYSASLDAWHLAQDFATLPVLDFQFIKENPPMDRIRVVPDEPDFIFDAYFKYKSTRPMPTYSVPGMIDHF